jgi:hypothetical protein
MPTSPNELDTQDLARPPVFVDPSGRRRRVLRYVALGACALFVCYLITFIAALLGAPVPRSGLIPLPEPAQPTQWQDPHGKRRSATLGRPSRSWWAVSGCPSATGGRACGFFACEPVGNRSCDACGRFDAVTREA